MTPICFSGSVHRLSAQTGISTRAIPRYFDPSGAWGGVKEYYREFRSREAFIRFIKEISPTARKAFIPHAARAINTARFFSHGGPASHHQNPLRLRLQMAYAVKAKDFPAPALFLWVLWREGDYSDSGIKRALSLAQEAYSKNWEFVEQLFDEKLDKSFFTWTGILERIEEARKKYPSWTSLWRSDYCKVPLAGTINCLRFEAPEFSDDLACWALIHGEFTDGQLQEMCCRFADNKMQDRSHRWKDDFQGTDIVFNLLLETIRKLAGKKG